MVGFIQQLRKQFRQSKFYQSLQQQLAPLHQRYKAFDQAYPKLSLAIKVVGGFGIITFLFLFSLFVLTYFEVFGPIPTYAELKNIRHYNASEVYAQDEVLIGKYYVENRINASAEEISPDVINALVATEDARFFEHSGVDMRSAMRVVVKSLLLSDRSSGGGSTLSQQLAKNIYPRKRYMAFGILINKFREMLIARRLERTYDKPELLNLYLNTVPFSENIYGIKVAAQRFFNKSPENLKIEEAALLIGMLKATTYYNPLRNPERALTRRNTVLNQMEKYNYIDDNSCDSLKAIPINTELYYKEGENEGMATYFREHLRIELEDILSSYEKEDGSPYNIYTDGLKIYTTLNARMQQHAEAAVATHMEQLQASFYKDWKKRDPWGSKRNLEKAIKKSSRYSALSAQGKSHEEILVDLEQPIPMHIYDWNGGAIDTTMAPLDSIKYYLSLLNTGFLAIEPQSGLVRAWVGGTDHEFFQYDHVKSRRQVGSTFKPIVFASALQNGMLPCEYTQNHLVTYPEYESWEPKNADGKYGGVYSMEGALSKSVNVVTVEVMRRSSVDSVQQLAKAMGIKSYVPKVPSISLGAVEASLLDMTRVYGTLANSGRRPKLHYLDRIETADGEIIVQFKRPNPKRFPRVLEENEANMMLKMMEAVVDSGTARKLRYEYRLRMPIAGKTGTTQNHADGWFMGITPKLVAGAWVGADNPGVHFRTMRRGQGSSTALPIWGQFMRNVVRDPALKKYHWGRFPSLPDTLNALMECPHYLEDMPILVDIYQDFDENPGFFERLFGRKDQPDYERQAPKTSSRNTYPRRRQGESRQEYEERLRRYELREAKKEERREKRKEFWSKLLFKDQQ